MKKLLFVLIKEIETFYLFFLRKKETELSEKDNPFTQNVKEITIFTF